MRQTTTTIILLLATCLGCGSSKWSDTQRTATEQLLLSDAMDRAVSQLDFRALAGKKVYLDTKPMASGVDAAYLASTLRQHMLASGCLLKDKIEDADYIVEARTGSVGTDNHSLLIGVPQTSLPTGGLLSGTAAIPTSIPEIPLAKKMEQRAIVKVALFAYNRETGRPVWQSGLVTTESKAKHRWIAGAGPFESGSIYDGTKFAGDRVKIPLIDPDRHDQEKPNVSVADEAYFIEPRDELAMAKRDEAHARKDTPGPSPEPVNGGQNESPPLGPLTFPGPNGFDNPPQGLYPATR